MAHDHTHSHENGTGVTSLGLATTQQAKVKSHPSKLEGGLDDGFPVFHSSNGTRSLSFILDIWIGIAYVSIMAVLALVEYFQNPGLGFADFAVHHLSQFVLYGLLFWGISSLVIRHFVVKPIREICHHLYAVGAGDHSLLRVPEKVREVRDIADAVNLMLWRMDHPPADEISHLEDGVEGDPVMSGPGLDSSKDA
ncbi:MAG: hypothetical protein WD490_02735 [Opitutales bacterium]